jgi:hypothetical protein
VQSPFGGERNVNPFEHLFAKPAAAKRARTMDSLLTSLRAEMSARGTEAQWAASSRNRNATAATGINQSGVKGNVRKVESILGSPRLAATQAKESGASAVRLNRAWMKAARGLRRALVEADALQALKTTPQPGAVTPRAGQLLREALAFEAPGAGRT